MSIVAFLGLAFIRLPRIEAPLLSQGMDTLKDAAKELDDPKEFLFCAVAAVIFLGNCVDFPA